MTIDAPLKPIAKPRVVLAVSSAAFDSRSVEMTTTDGVNFESVFVPVIPVSDLSFVSAEVEFANGTLRCQFPKTTIRLDGAETQSTEIRQIERTSTGYQVQKCNDESLAAKSLTGLPPSISLGSMQLDIDFSSATRFRFSTGARSSLELSIQLFDGDVLMQTQTELIQIEGRPADDLLPMKRLEESGSRDGFASLGASRMLPDYLTTSDAVSRTEKGGVRFTSVNRRNNEPGGVIWTKERHYLDRDFVFDVLLEFEPGDRIAYIGLGAGRADTSYNGLTDSVYLRFHAPDVGIGGGIDVQNWNKGQTELPGKVPNWGVNRVRITKEGTAVSFQIDPQNDGPTDDDFELTIPNMREFAPYLNSKNSNLFLAGSGTFLATRLQESKAGQ